jgi:hypothetical protein
MRSHYDEAAKKASELLDTVSDVVANTIYPTIASGAASLSSAVSQTASVVSDAAETAYTRASDAADTVFTTFSSAASTIYQIGSTTAEITIRIAHASSAFMNTMSGNTTTSASFQPDLLCHEQEDGFLDLVTPDQFKKIIEEKYLTQNKVVASSASSASSSSASSASSSSSTSVPPCPFNLDELDLLNEAKAMVSSPSSQPQGNRLTTNEEAQGPTPMKKTTPAPPNKPNPISEAALQAIIAAGLKKTQKPTTSDSAGDDLFAFFKKGLQNKNVTKAMNGQQEPESDWDDDTMSSGKSAKK